jgi:uncharacterized protein GlcG (DUF336 family)
MPEWLTEILDHASFTEEDREALQKQEASLLFPSFSEGDSSSLLACIQEEAEKEHVSVAAAVFDENGAVVDQMIMPGTSERNIDFAKGKAMCALHNGCSSLHVLADLADEKNIAIQEGDLPVAGGTAICTEKGCRYAVGLSGLKDGKDHQILIRGIASYLKRIVPEYTGWAV